MAFDLSKQPLVQEDSQEIEGNSHGKMIDGQKVNAAGSESLISSSRHVDNGGEGLCQVSFFTIVYVTNRTMS